MDEEGLYPSMVEAAERWRNKFMQIGVPFDWYCLPFKQVCVLDSLSSSESWITWEPGKEDVWMRQPPPYAITKSKYLKYAGEKNYQSFFDVANSDGISIIGLRASESFTRRQTIASMKEGTDGTHKFYPIYDWGDEDVWRYIKERNLEFPEIYIRLYEAGVTRPALRLCAFFGDRTTQGLRWIAETDPDLWERIERRMPNAYLALLYWDSEMFMRSTKSRKKMEEDVKQTRDYKAMVEDVLFKNTDKYRINHDTRKTLGLWRGLYIRTNGIATNGHYKMIYETLIYGDPKGRMLRIIQNKIYTSYYKSMKGVEKK